MRPDSQKEFPFKYIPRSKHHFPREKGYVGVQSFLVILDHFGSIRGSGRFFMFEKLSLVCNIFVRFRPDSKTIRAENQLRKNCFCESKDFWLDKQKSYFRTRCIVVLYWVVLGCQLRYVWATGRQKEGGLSQGAKRGVW